MVVERLLENLLLRAEQIAAAMDVRGFTSPNEHQVRWHQLVLRRWDWFCPGTGSGSVVGENCLGGPKLEI